VHQTAVHTHLALEMSHSQYRRTAQIQSQQLQCEYNRNMSLAYGHISMCSMLLDLN